MIINDCQYFTEEALCLSQIFSLIIKKSSIVAIYVTNIWHKEINFKTHIERILFR